MNAEIENRLTHIKRKESLSQNQRRHETFLKCDEQELKKFPESKTAKRVSKSLLHMRQVLGKWTKKQSLTNKDTSEILDQLYLACKSATEIVGFPDDIYSPLIQHLFREFETNRQLSSDQDRKLRVCIATLAMDGRFSSVIPILEEGIARYPNEQIFYPLIVCAYVKIGKFQKSLECAEKGVSRFQHNPHLLYFYGILLLPTESSEEPELTCEAFELFLERAPNDHPLVPDVYYRIAFSYMSYTPSPLTQGSEFFNLGMANKAKSAEANMKIYFQMGKEAEASQMKCFQPYDSKIKIMVEAFIKATEDERRVKPMKKEKALGKKFEIPSKFEMANPEANFFPCAEGNVFIKFKRTTEEKAIMIKQFRHSLSMLEDLPKCPEQYVTTKPKLIQPPFENKNFDQLKSIRLRDMDPSRDFIYLNRILKLTIIEQPMVGYFPAIHCLVKDENGIVTKLHVYNLPHDEKAYDLLEYGCQVGVINPYMRISADYTNGIRVDEPINMRSIGRLVNMCRYCSKADAEWKCSKCKWANYCGRDCQVNDWKQFNHATLCKKIY